MGDFKIPDRSGLRCPECGLPFDGDDETDRNEHSFCFQRARQEAADPPWWEQEDDDEYEFEDD